MPNNDIVPQYLDILDIHFSPCRCITAEYINIRIGYIRRMFHARKKMGIQLCEKHLIYIQF